MIVLIDTNVIIDYLIEREPFYTASREIIRRCAEKEMKGYLAFHTVPNLWYILRRVPEDRRRKWLYDLCSFLRVAGAEHDEVLRAIGDSDFSDFEDCLQDKCAKGVKAQFIITRNTDDFACSDVKAILPEDFLLMLKTGNKDSIT